MNIIREYYAKNTIKGTYLKDIVCKISTLKVTYGTYTLFLNTNNKTKAIPCPYSTLKQIEDEYELPCFNCSIDCNNDCCKSSMVSNIIKSNTILKKNKKTFDKLIQKEG